MKIRHRTRSGLPRSATDRSQRWIRLRAFAYWLSVAFIFMVPWEAAVHVGAIGRLSKAMGLTAGVVWAILVVERRRFRQPILFQKIFFLFVVWNAATFFWSLDPAHTLGGVLTYTQVFLLLLVLWDLYDSDTAIVSGLQAYVLGAYVSAGSVIANFMSTPAARFPRHQRFAALGFEVDGIALIIAIAAPAALYLAAGPASRQRSHVWMVVNYAYIPVALFAVALTGTRGAVLASIPTMIFALATLWRASGARRVLALVSIVSAIVVVISFAPPEMLVRISSAAGEVIGNGEPSGAWGEGDIGGRADIWTESLQAFSDRPIGGVGLGAHRSAVSFEKVAHNTYLSVLTEAGVVGFLLFAGILWAIWTRVRLHSGWNRRYWFTQLAVIAIGATSLSLEDSKSVWIFVALAVASTATMAGDPGRRQAERTSSRLGAGQS